MEQSNKYSRLVDQFELLLRFEYNNEDQYYFNFMGFNIITRTKRITDINSVRDIGESIISQFQAEFNPGSPGFNYDPTRYDTDQFPSVCRRVRALTDKVLCDMNAWNRFIHKSKSDLMNRICNAYELFNHPNDIVDPDHTELIRMMSHMFDKGGPDLEATVDLVFLNGTVVLHRVSQLEYVMRQGDEIIRLLDHLLNPEKLSNEYYLTKIRTICYNLCIDTRSGVVYLFNSTIQDAVCLFIRIARSIHYWNLPRRVEKFREFISESHAQLEVIFKSHSKYQP